MKADIVDLKSKMDLILEAITAKNAEKKRFAEEAEK
jgi:hypothetical protein